MVAFAYELRAAGGADPAATVADDPEEELFAVVFVEAAMGGVCEFEVGLLMDSVVVMEKRVEEGGHNRFEGLAG